MTETRITTEGKQPLNHDIAEATRQAKAGAQDNSNSKEGKTKSNDNDNDTIAVEVFRTDYRPLRYIVNKVHLDFVLEPGKTTVTTDMFVGVNPDYVADDGKVKTDSSSDDVLVLNGQETDVALWSIAIDDRELQRGKDYELEPGKLILKCPQPNTRIRTVVSVPESNTILEGLFKSDGVYCTQCEADGFRRITYYPDRPDNIALFERVRIESLINDYPVLLSNGVPIDEGTLDDGLRHYKVWSDVFPKPSYLFALVAGDLEYIEDFYVTRPSRRRVTLRIYSKAQYVDKLQHAMASLKKAMKWDEDTFGLEYDSELYNIVAVDDFNAGAMENKSLNIFNARNILADAKSATDEDFQRVESIIAHEYFHNWTGNRVTCRDWFQLTLKEGLTVYRDQRFSSDMNSAAVKRINTVRSLRTSQFSEDAGPMSHPVRPDSYQSMDNFYTATVYDKGAEIIRMYETLLSTDGFRKGMDLYIQRHDGQAVACEEFLQAMQDANEVDLSQFMRWYSTPGTPVVTFSHQYDHNNNVFSLTMRQASKCVEALHIPIAIGLLDKATGKEVVPTTVLELKEMEQTFVFPALSGEVVPSLLRNFSAPIRLEPALSQHVNGADLSFLAVHDKDNFIRWEAGQKLYSSLILKRMKGDPTDKITREVCQFFEQILSQQDASVDCGMLAYAMVLPLEDAIAGELTVVNFIEIHAARSLVQQLLARKFYTQLTNRYRELTQKIKERSCGKLLLDAASIGQRHLRNVILQLLCTIKETPEEQKTAAGLAAQHMQSATGMSDKYTALVELASMDGAGANARIEALKVFYDEADGYNLVVDKWFAAQALSDLPDAVNRVKKLMDHAEYSYHRPNRCKAVINSFTMNYKAFHDESGKGYQLVGEAIAQLDRVNPNASSAIAAKRFIQWQRYDKKRGGLLKAELLKLKSLNPRISVDLDEIITRALALDTAGMTNDSKAVLGDATSMTATDPRKAQDDKLGLKSHIQQQLDSIHDGVLTDTGAVVGGHEQVCIDLERMERGIMSLPPASEIDHGGGNNGSSRARPGAYAATSVSGAASERNQDLRFHLVVDDAGHGHDNNSAGGAARNPPEVLPTANISDDGHHHSQAGLAEAIPVDENNVSPVEAQQLDAGKIHRQQIREEGDRCCKMIAFGLVAVACSALAVALVLLLGTQDDAQAVAVAPPSLAPSQAPGMFPTSAPTGTLDLLLQDLPEYTLASLDSIQTPQSKALDWLSMHPDLPTMPEWRKIQLFALATFFFALDGPNWREEISNDWLDPNKNECNWFSSEFGEFNAFGAVYKVSNRSEYMTPCNERNETHMLFLGRLGFFNDSVYIPPEISLLASLEVLALPDNAVNMSLSDFMPMEQLVILPNLTHLQLHSNWLTGTIPTELGLITSLKALMLNKNGLTGTLPTELGLLTSLANVRLHESPLNGTIPSELGLWKNISRLILFRNDFSGSIPSEVFSLRSLQRWELLENNLSGSIATEIGQSSLNYLDMGRNRLSGPIPTEFGSVTTMRSMYLYDNALTGTLPTELGLMNDTRTLQLFNNSLWGTLPSELGMMAQNYRLRLHSSNLDGTIPSEMENMLKLNWLQLADNQLSGSIPSGLLLRTKLAHVYLQDNLLTGFLPTIIGSMAKLKFLHLEGNLFSGQLPTELGTAASLQRLLIQNNIFSSSIPTELGNATKLQFLGLGSNTLTGQVPTELGLLTSLIELDLSNSSLTGTISNELGALVNSSSLLYLDISGTAISGTIPEGLCALNAHNGTCSYEREFLAVLLWDPVITRECALIFDCSATLCGCNCDCS